MGTTAPSPTTPVGIPWDPRRLRTQALADACRGLQPSWTLQAQSLLGRWEQLHVCMPRYGAFMAKCNRKDLKRPPWGLGPRALGCCGVRRPHVFMNEKAQAALGEFYLCCALRLRAQEVEAAGQAGRGLIISRHIQRMELIYITSLTYMFIILIHVNNLFAVLILRC